MLKIIFASCLNSWSELARNSFIVLQSCEDSPRQSKTILSEFPGTVVEAQEVTFFNCNDHQVHPLCVKHQNGGTPEVIREYSAACNWWLQLSDTTDAIREPLLLVSIEYVAAETERVRLFAASSALTFLQQVQLQGHKPAQVAKYISTYHCSS